MADNYLEKRFEEHYAQSAQKKSTPHKAMKVRRVLVTGGAHGIGEAIVRNMRVAGHNVAFCDIDDERGEEIARTTGTRYFHCDVRDAEALETLFGTVTREWGDVDILVNNVGVSEFKPLTEMSVEDFDNVLSINLRPVFILSKLMAQYRKNLATPNRYGRIINMCSTRYLQSEAGTEAYSASKGGIYSLTHALSQSLAPMKITVNCISPGWIETGDYAALSEADHEQHPSGRVGKTQDIARMVRFLCDEENDFINGQNITIDGGMTTKMIYV